jgi:hypothetical protein
MMEYLDLSRSSATAPNENYSRELMELFTLGVGNYTETDVREGARALTGWYVDQTGTVSFRERAFDAGRKTFLGHTGDFGVDEVVDIILAHPATPKHTATKIWETGRRRRQSSRGYTAATWQSWRVWPSAWSRPSTASMANIPVFAPRMPAASAPRAVSPPPRKRAG